MKATGAASSQVSAATPDAQASPISGRLVICLGLSQLVGWGTMHYLIAVFGNAIRSDFGWSPAFAQSGFSLALIVMGLTSGRVGRWIDQHGGRSAMMAGCWIGAAGCALLATTQGQVQYFCGWLLLGLAMRLSLYDAAFAALAHVGGGAARRAMARITLFGGLASAAFWPLGQFLLDHIGWRGALGVYAALLMLASVLHFALPASRRGALQKSGAIASVAAGSKPTPTSAFDADKWLYGFIAASVIFMQLGLTAHFIELLRSAHWDAATAVSLASVFGPGQFSDRVFVVAWAWRVDAIRLNLLPAVLLCGCFVIYLLAGTRSARSASVS